jgi:hypothetical protein
MKDLLIGYLKNSLGGHLLAVALIVAGCFVGHSWLVEHDNRVIAEQTVKASQIQIDSLQKQYAAADAAAKVTLAALQARAAEVKTPAQAVQAVQAAPTLSDFPLNARPVVGMPDVVTVEALPLFQELNQCKQDAVALASCTEKLDLEQKIVAQKDVQVTALKKKKGFWARLKREVIDTVVTVGIGAALGYAMHR